MTPSDKENDSKIWRNARLSAIALVIIVFQALANYWLQSRETAALAELTAKTQLDVVAVLKVLSEKVKAEDAALLQDAKRCRQEYITDRKICGAAGVVIRE